jgi:hypothetical protein
MSSEVETSRDETNRYVHGILRLRCAPLRMTARRYAQILFALACVSTISAQESPTPTPSAITEEPSALSISPVESVTPPPAPEQTPSVSPAKSVRISFIPPPLEGRISLGIYDAKGKLVRVLHQEADVNEFKIGADALVTQWDGKNDDGEDLPAAKYHARGYLVGQLKVEDLSQTEASPPENNSVPSVKVKLMPNPLANDKRAIVELAVAFDSDGSYLKTSDDLPLFAVSESPNLIRVSIMKKGDTSVDIWQTDGAGFHQFHISNVDQMMAFDCGEFELK